MINEQHNIDGQDVFPPVNADDITIELKFDDDQLNSEGRSETVSVTEFDWRKGEAAILKAIKDSGTTGGAGVFRGIPHILTISDGVNNKVFNLQINLKTATFGDNQVLAESRPKQGGDWLNDVADGITFERLYAEGKITKSDFVFIPYIKSDIPDYREAFMVTLAFALIAIELNNVITQVTAKGTESASFIDSLGGIINLIALIVYIILLIVILIDLILDIADLIIQKVKYIPGMYVNDLMRIACNELGITYESPLLSSNEGQRMVIIPESLNPARNIEDNRILGAFSSQESDATGFYRQTFGQLLRDLKETFALRILPSEGKIKLLPINYIPDTATFQLPDVDQQDITTNASELFSQFNYTFQYDNNELNTIRPWIGNNVDVTITHPSLPKDDTNLFKLGKLVNSPFARGKIKEDLTQIEKLVDFLFGTVEALFTGVTVGTNIVVDSVNFIIRTINKTLSPIFRLLGLKDGIPTVPRVKALDISGIIDNRIGMLLLEKDTISVQKLILIDQASNEKNTKVSQDNQTFINAKYIYENFYKQTNQQFHIKELTNIEMNMSDVLNVANEGAVKLASGEVVKVVSCKWQRSTQLATFVIAEPRDYINNLVEQITEPDGR